MQRFSTVIACEYDPNTRRVTSSQRLTPLHHHQET
jgi:hypothetical protein